MSFFYNRTFLSAQIGYIILVLLTLIIFPGAHIVYTLLAMIAVWSTTAMIYKYTPWANRTGWWALLITTAALSIGAIINIHYFTTIAATSTELPSLLNSDSSRFYHDALYSIGHPSGISTDIKNHGYGLIISWIWHITGITIVAPIIINMLLMLLSIILCGGIASLILQNKTPKTTEWIATCAIIMSASICYFLNSGTLLLKEAFLIFAFALIGFTIIALMTHKTSRLKKIILLISFIIGLAIISFMRYNLLFIPIIGILLLLRKNSLKIGFSLITINIISISLVSFILYQYNLNIPESTTNIIDGENIAIYYFNVPDQASYYNILDGYFSYPWWKKIITLPLTAATQYLIPLPWGFCDDIHFGYTLAYAHIAYPWYIIGGLILYYIIFSPKSPSILKKVTLWGVLMWLIPAYLFAGIVSRYTLPFLPFLIPSAVYIVATWKQHKFIKKWLLCYSILLIIALTITYSLQEGGLS